MADSCPLILGGRGTIARTGCDVLQRKTTHPPKRSGALDSHPQWWWLLLFPQSSWSGLMAMGPLWTLRQCPTMSTQMSFSLKIILRARLITGKYICMLQMFTLSLCCNVHSFKQIKFSFRTNSSHFTSVLEIIPPPTSNSSLYVSFVYACLHTHLVQVLFFPSANLVLHSIPYL